MAKFELKFKDVDRDQNTIETRVYDQKEIEIKLTCKGLQTSCIYLDKSTAIKFAKTLRTEINKITESEVSNG